MPLSVASRPTTSPRSNGYDRVAGSADVGWTAGILLALLGAYKTLISPLFTGSCRYYPSCSTYMAEAIEIHGTARGLWLGLRRLSRCHPFGSSGVDPVPPRRT
jgi:putative membrane protein insertion efficiency factor